MAEFPKLTKSQRHGLVGMPILELFVLEVAKYVLRQTPQQVDMGIDGYIDIIDPSDSATGRCVGFQLKCGPSFLRHKEPGAFVYYGEFRHLNLFMNHPVPVMLILADPSTKEMWWVQFDITKTEGTENGWRIQIPFGNKCGPDTSAKWNAIAGPHTDYTQHANAEWRIKKLIKERDRILFSIPREHIEKMRFDFILDSFARLTSSRSIIESKRNAVVFGIDGYDNDKELWEIPQVCQWWQLAESVGKYWFYFCTTDNPYGTLNTLRMCVTGARLERHDKEKNNFHLSTDGKKDRAFLVRNFEWLNEFTDRYEMPLSVNFQISEAVSEHLYPDIHAKMKAKRK